MAKQATVTAVEEVKEVTSTETELEVLTAMAAEVQRLDKDARVRVMKYILDRFGIYLPSSY